MISLGPNDDITRFEYIKRASKEQDPVLIGVTLANKHDYAGLVNRIERFDPSFINLNGNETLYNMLVWVSCRNNRQFKQYIFMEYIAFLWRLLIWYA